MDYSLLSVIVGLTASKLWHDTLRIFINAFMVDCTRELLEQYISWNVSGVMLGGVMAGFFTDSLTPSRTFPTSVMSISILSFLLIFTYTIPSLINFLWHVRIGISIFLAFLIIQGKSKGARRLSFLSFAIITTMTFLNIDVRLSLLFLRGMSIAIAMNSAYVAVGDMYKGDPFLPRASGYLYLSLFAALGFYPLLFEYLPTKTCFIVASGLMAILSLILKRTIPKTKSTAPSFRRYFSSWPILIKKPEFLLSCGVSMICIGGFYNNLYIFTDASIHKDYLGNISRLQSLGRQCTFLILFLISVLNLRRLQIKNSNCAQFMSIAMLIVSISSSFLLLLHYRLPATKLNLLAELTLLISCLATGIAQPAAKTAIISIAQFYNKNITGSAQSFVTLMNSAIEYGGSKIILAYMYPNGSRIYLIILTFSALVISLGLFLRRKQINITLAKKE